MWLLLDAGADSNIPPGERSPYNQALSNGHTAVAGLLHKHKATPSDDGGLVAFIIFILVLVMMIMLCCCMSDGDGESMCMVYLALLFISLVVIFFL